MEKTTEKHTERRDGFTKLVLRENIIVTVLDLSSSNLTCVDNIDFPTNLIELNLSHNELRCIPTPVMNLKNIKLLNFTFNKIKFFDETPAFCHNIEKLNLANNELCGPPYWVWCEYPRNLRDLDVSGNRNIRKSLTDEYFSELLQYKTSLTAVNMHSCSFHSHYELLGTFANAKILNLCSETLITSNYFSNVPSKGLDKCCDLERLNLRCTYVALINSNIDIYKNLIEINLYDNRVSSLPNEFCNLKNLEVCILSYNNIIYLPDDIVKLKKLTTLCVDSNKLCMLPENLNELENLTKLDVYDNYIYDTPDCPKGIQELDLAQNYFDEPEDNDYKLKKKQLRTDLEERIDGRKFEIERSESRYSSRSIDEELENVDYSRNTEETNDSSRALSSPEDWDSDDYWVPHFSRTSAPPQSPWIFFVKRKMAEGNFCPIDAHTVPVAEKVQYEKLCNPHILHESDGQFDDYSSDDS